MKVDIRRKGKIDKVMEFVEKMRKMQKEVETALRKSQNEIKRQVNKEQKKAECYIPKFKLINNQFVRRSTFA